MQSRISDKTIERLEEHTGKPISRGVDKAVQECLDKLEELQEVEGGSREQRVRICTNTEEMAEQ